MKYTKEMLEDAVKNSVSFAAVARYLGASSTNSVREHLRNRIIKLGLDYSHFEGKGWSKTRNFSHSTKIKAVDILVKSAKMIREPSSRLRRALLEIGREYKCQICQIDTWQGKKIKLEIHHVDGDWSNNLESNLMIVCPNCHSQLDEEGP